jgi:hypothetical protein
VSTPELDAFERKVHAGHYRDYDRYEFEDAILRAYGVTENPKAEKAFSIAWDLGHGGGNREVAILFDELVELIK